MNRLPDRRKGAPRNSGIYWNRLPAHAKKKFIWSTLCVIGMLVIGIPMLYNAGIIRYNWHLYLAFFILAICEWATIRDVEKERKEYVEQQNFDRLTHAVEGTHVQRMSDDERFCPYCGKPTKADAMFCSYCGKEI